MGIDGTIKTLSKIHKSIKQGIPNTITNPDGLVDYVNKLYGKFALELNLTELSELFEYDQIPTLKIHLIIYIEEEFDPQKVKQNMEAKLGIVPNHPNNNNEIKIEGVAWSYGRYDFMYKESSQNLIISHPYRHEAQYIRSINTIIKKMIGYANGYLQEVKKSID